ncbi:MAG: endo-1,4-beta-xylanase, partial [Spirochaetota bacterium]
LVRVHTNARWAIYLPKSPPVPAPPATPEAPMENPLSALEEMGPVDPEPPPEVYNREVWQAEQRFFSETVLPNIEKHRKSDVILHVVGPDGRPIRDLAVEVRQVKQAFGFGCSLGFFIVPSTPKAWGDFKPPAVTEAELEAFPKVFNHSLIPFSGKWMHLEGTEGVRWFEDLDRYVEWCASHGISMEYHFVSGYAPPWLKQKKPEERAALFLNHARELAQRYGDRIRSWQVVNEKHLLEHSPAVFEELRRLMPKASLGISDCANFWSDEPSPRREKLLHRGLDEIRWLKSKGIQVDFFGFHGHRPFGVWPDPREMYEILDAFQKEGVRVHVTEFSLPIPSPILGPSRRGTWTPALQAEFYRWFFTVLFSHPAVDSVNLWGIGPEVWQKGSGLLDEKYQPKPNFFALQDLTQREFLTRLDGRLSPEGTLAFRAFHGEYEILLTLPSGQKARAAFAVAPGAANAPRFRLDPATATLSAP